MNGLLLSDVADLDMSVRFNGQGWRSPMSQMHKRLLRDLVDQGFCTKDRLIEQLWPAEDGGPLYAERIIHLYVHHIRKALRPGWQIVTQWGYGYSLVCRELVEIRQAA